MLNIGQRVLVLLPFLFWYSQGAQGLQVQIKDANNYCLVVPKDYQTAIGASEYDGGEAVWCQGSKTDPSDGTFQGSFWTRPEVTYPKEGVIQMAGCINVNSCDRLKPDDDGGQYDSNGGEGGRGNPAGSTCGSEYPVYVQLVEPSAGRACIRCCKNQYDCNVSQDTAGCPTVIPGNYEGCS